MKVWVRPRHFVIDFTNFNHFVDYTINSLEQFYFSHYYMSQIIWFTVICKICFVSLLFGHSLIRFWSKRIATRFVKLFELGNSSISKNILQWSTVKVDHQPNLKQSLTRKCGCFWLLCSSTSPACSWKSSPSMQVQCL